MENFLELCQQESLDRDYRVRQVRSLLDTNKLDPRIKDAKGWCPIHYAAQYGRLEIVRFLLPRCDPRVEVARSRFTALHLACTNGRLDVVEALLDYYQRGAPADVDRDGNTPLHHACGYGSLEIVHRLLSKYQSNTIAEPNGRGVTPLGVALSGNHYNIARHFMKHSAGNPAQKFPDFREHFPSLSREQSLEHPVSIFVMGNKNTGKSTLIKSLQVEGYLNRAFGAFVTTSGVEHHSGGIVPSDVSSYGYGRAKFYELASCRESTQENIFLSLEKPAHSLFLITLSCKDEMKDMEATMLYWLSFINHQYRSEGPGMRPSVAVVVSFLYYHRVGDFRLDNFTRLRKVYHRVLAQHNELCSRFYFLGKFSMDCRRSESLGMRQLRSILHRKCREMRPTGGEKSIPSSCYTLLCGLKEIGSEIPVLKLSDIEHHISQHDASSKSLLGLLPANADDLKPLLEILEERKAIVMIKHLNPRDPWVIYNEYKLISKMDATLIEKFKTASQTSDFNPAVMPIETLLEFLSPLALKKGILLNLLHGFKMIEVMSHRETTKYFLPSILKEMQLNTKCFKKWKRIDGDYSFGFAWCIVPKPTEMAPYFMPRFLYFLLYELYATAEEEGDMNTVIMSHLGLYCKMASEIEICITIDSAMVNLHMRCIKGEEVICLQFRNRFLSAIHQHRKILQPNLEVDEYIVSMETTELPITKPRLVKECGRNIEELRSDVIKKSDHTSIEKELSLEPYIWCKNLSESHLRNLLDPTLTTALVSDQFLQDLKEQMQDKHSVIYSALGIISSDINTSGEELEEEKQPSDHDIPQYGQVLEFFSEISIFQSASEFYSALKNPDQYDMTSPHNRSQDELDDAEEREIATNRDDSSTTSPPSSNESPNQTPSFTPSSGPSPLLKLHVPGQQSDVRVCSSTDGDETLSVLSARSSVPALELVAQSVASNTTTTMTNINFIGNIEKFQCDSKGGKYEHTIHGIAFYIPPGAVKERSSLTLKFGVATVGPFKYPDNTSPVSPVLWVQVELSNGQSDLKKSIEISIHHAVVGNDGAKYLRFLCCSKLTGTAIFENVHKKSTISPEKGILHTKFSRKQYCFCIGSKYCRELIVNTQYCIVKVTPAKSDPSNIWKMYFFVTYKLPACIEMVKKQFQDDYMVSESSFSFDTSGRRDPSIAIEFQRLLPEKWTLCKEATYQQIMPLDVDFGRMNFHAYPPNFTVVVNGRNAVKDSVAVFQFKGTIPVDLVYEEPLIQSTALHRSASSVIASSDTQDTPVFEYEACSDIHLDTESLCSSQQSTRSLAVLPSSKMLTVHWVTTGRGRASSVVDSPTMDRKKMKSKEQVNEIIKTTLQRRFRIIIKQLVQTEVRQFLYEHEMLTDAEYDTLLSLPTTATANERLFFMIKKKGTAAFYDFLNVLTTTAHECPGHVEIYDALTSDLQKEGILLPHNL